MSAGVEAAHSQYVTVGAGVVNIVMTLISVSDPEYPFHWGALSRCPQSPLRGAGDTGPGSLEGHTSFFLCKIVSVSAMPRC